MRSRKAAASQPLRAKVVAFPVQRGLGAGERVCAAGVTRAGALGKARAPVGRSPLFRRADPLRAWQSTARALRSRPMPPFTRQHPLRKCRPGVPPLLALAAAAGYNRSVKADRVLARCACQRASAYVQRYVP